MCQCTVPQFNQRYQDNMSVRNSYGVNYPGNWEYR